jgi:pyridoxine kinase
VEGILSIQSAVAYGHVGNSAAVFPLQRLGFEVWPVMTVLFSNHTGYGTWRGRAVDIEWVREVIIGIEERGALASCQAVLSGYLGAPESGDVVLEALEKARAVRPTAIYACDPVMGDIGRGFFVKPGIPEFFKEKAVPAADIITPNQFELAYLADRPIAGLGDAIEAAAAVQATGPQIIVVTSLQLQGEDDMLGVLVHTREGSWLVRTPLLPVTLNGTGDAFTALYLGYYLKSSDPKLALEQATAAMYGLVALTHRHAARELLLVAAQDLLTAPDRTFPAERVA